MFDKYFSTNRARWEEMVGHHMRSRFYDLEGFKQGKNSLMCVEREELGDVARKNILHSQCHFGMDSLSLARLGASVTGIDFSREGIQKAKELAMELNVPARFIQTNVYDIPSVLTDTFDIVFTTYGVLCWLPDLITWAKILADRLKPGGFLYLSDTHPFGALLDESIPEEFRIKYPYFNEHQVFRFDDSYSYTDLDSPIEHTVTYEWMHSLADILNAIIHAGLVLDYLHEFPFCFFRIHPEMTLRPDGYYDFIHPEKFNIPLMFSLKAHKIEEKKVYCFTNS